MSKEDEQVILRAVKAVISEYSRADYETDQIVVKAYRIPLSGDLLLYRLDIRIKEE